MIIVVARENEGAGPREVVRLEPTHRPHGVHGVLSKSQIEARPRRKVSRSRAKRRAERLLRDRLPPCCGDLHPDDGLFSTIEGYARHRARGQPVDH
jgi:hypothetical protein